MRRFDSVIFHASHLAPLPDQLVTDAPRTQFLEYFFAEPDAAFFKSLGLNCIRIAISYRHFEDDMNPGVLKPEGFKHLDRAIAACAKHGIYTILDMHTAPGGQNGGWHSDHGAHIAGFWIHKDFQDRLVWLWTEVAKHYKDEKVSRLIDKSGLRSINSFKVDCWVQSDE